MLSNRMNPNDPSGQTPPSVPADPTPWTPPTPPAPPEDIVVDLHPNAPQNTDVPLIDPTPQPAVQNTDQLMPAQDMQAPDTANPNYPSQATPLPELFAPDNAPAYPATPAPPSYQFPGVNEESFEPPQPTTPAPLFEPSWKPPGAPAPAAPQPVYDQFTAVPNQLPPVNPYDPSMQPPLATGATPESGSPKSKRKLIIILSGVAVLLISGIVAGLLLTGGSSNKQNNQQPNEQTEEPTNVVAIPETLSDTEKNDPQIVAGYFMYAIQQDDKANTDRFASPTLASTIGTKANGNTSFYDWCAAEPACASFIKDYDLKNTTISIGDATASDGVIKKRIKYTRATTDQTGVTTTYEVAVFMVKDADGWKIEEFVNGVSK